MRLRCTKSVALQAGDARRILGGSHDRTAPHPDPEFMTPVAGLLMRAVALTGTGGLEHLALTELPVPPLSGPHEVRVRIEAAALNRLDLFVAEGVPGVAYRFPHVVGADGAGVVEEVGSAVTTVRPGDRVMLNPGLSCGTCAECRSGEESLCPAFQLLGEHRHGTLAEYVVVPEANLAPVPPAMPWTVAAAFPLATLTAWRMLVTRARLQAGETVLIWGIGGGVAQALLRLALRLGATTIVTSGSDAKLDAARADGAHHVVNHRTGDVVAAVRAATANRGADVIADSVGEPTWPASLRVLRRGGRLVTCGATGGPHVSLDVRRLFWHQWSLLGSTMGSRAEFAAIAAVAAAGGLWPRVDSVVPLARAPEAFRRLAAGEQLGKLVIEVGS
jgi:NADPH:quinone reductase-like Zn-dependent oxidoreductase